MPKNAAATLAILSTFFAACGDPCDPIVTEDTLIFPVTCLPSSTGDTGTSTTGDPVTPIDPKPDPLPVCIAIPVAGEEWGPCVNGECAAGLFCKVSGMGDVCLAACDVPGPCSAEKCIGGTCDMEIGACVAPCEAVGDPCPLPDMQCFFGPVPLCAYKF